MKKTDILVLDRDDLIDSAKETPIEKIKYYMFKGSLLPFEETALIIFVDEDENNTIAIIKNRYNNEIKNFV